MTYVEWIIALSVVAGFLWGFFCGYIWYKMELGRKDSAV